MSSGRVVVTSRPSSTYFDDGEDEEYMRTIPEEEKERTRAVLYEFLDEKSKQDREITHEQRSVIHESTVQCIREDASTSVEECAVTQIVRILQNHGDEFQRRIEEDEVLQDATTMAMEETDSSQSSVTRVLAHLKTVIGRLFEVDENGEPQNINLGRISAIFYYCYSICKNFVSRYFPRHTVVQFLFSLGSSLILFLARARFYQWLESRGGWLQALVSLFPSNSWSHMLLGSPNSTNNLMFVAGITLIVIWAYNRYIRQ